MGWYKGTRPASSSVCWGAKPDDTCSINLVTLWSSTLIWSQIVKSTSWLEKEGAYLWLPAGTPLLLWPPLLLAPPPCDHLQLLLLRAHLGASFLNLLLLRHLFGMMGHLLLHGFWLVPPGPSLVGLILMLLLMFMGQEGRSFLFFFFFFLFRFAPVSAPLFTRFFIWQKGKPGLPSVWKRNILSRLPTVTIAPLPLMKESAPAGSFALCTDCRTLRELSVFKWFPFILTGRNVTRPF